MNKIAKISYLILFYLVFKGSAMALTNSAPALASKWANVLQISSEAPDASGDSTPAFCNATLIGRNTLITAAHCIKPAYLSGVTKIDVEIGEYIYRTRKTDGKVVRVGYATKFKFSKDMRIEIPQTLITKFAKYGYKAPIGAKEDVALLWWTEDTPELENIPLAQLTTPDEHRTLLKDFKAAAFTAVTVNIFSEMSLDIKRLAIIDNVKWRNYIFSKSFSRLEEGDSGAPLFLTTNGSFKVFGVVKGRASTLFDNWDVYTPVQPQVCLMAMSLPKVINLNACKNL